MHEFKTSKTSKRHVLILNLTDKIDLRRDEKSIALSNLSLYYTWKYIKTHTTIINGMINFNYPMDQIRILYIQDYFEYFIKKHETVTDNPPIRIYVNKIENRITFKIKTGYYLELLAPETMKLLGSTENQNN